MLQLIEIGDHRIANRQRALGRLDQAVKISKAFDIPDPQALEQAHEDQRSEPLRGGRRVVERRAVDVQGKRRAPVGAIGLEVGARHRRADAFEIAGDFARDITAIEIIEAGMGELPKRFAKLRHFADIARLGRLAAGQIGRSKARRRH